RRVPGTGRRARVLHRLRRDRSLRGRRRHGRVRGVLSMTTVSSRIPDLAELAEASRELEHAPASHIVAWAHERYGDSMVLAASFQDCVLIDLAVDVVPELEVVFLDTGYHFAETLWYVDQVRRRYDLNLNVVTPAADVALDD